MALHYQTECRVGSRRVNRSYSGFQAFVAICFDLIFGLAFELVSAALLLTMRLFSLIVQSCVHVLSDGGKAALRVIGMFIYVVTFPFMLLHEAVVRSGPSCTRWSRHDQSAPARKPDWALGRDF